MLKYGMIKITISCFKKLNKSNMKKLLFCIFVLTTSASFAQDSSSVGKNTTISSVIYIGINQTDSPKTTFANTQVCKSLVNIFFDNYEAALYGFDSTRIEARKKQRAYLIKMAPISAKVGRWADEYISKGKSTTVITKKESKLYDVLVDKIKKGKLDRDLVATYIYHLPIPISPN